MAAYLDLRGEFNNDDLRNRVTTAVVIAAYNLLTGTPTANDRVWATQVIESPDAEGKKALALVLAANKDATIATIQGASDSAIQTNVDGVVSQLVLAAAGA